MATCSVKVVARFRPLNENEKKKNSNTQHYEFDLQFRNPTTVEVRVDKQFHTFSFDGVYDTDCLQVFTISDRSLTCLVWSLRICCKTLH